MSGFVCKKINLATYGSLEDKFNALNNKFCEGTGWSLDPDCWLNGQLKVLQDTSTGRKYISFNHLYGSKFMFSVSETAHRLFMAFLPPCTSFQNLTPSSPSQIEVRFSMSLNSEIYVMVDTNGHGVWGVVGNNVLILGDFIQCLSYPLEYTSPLDKLIFSEGLVLNNLYKGEAWETLEDSTITSSYLVSGYNPQGADKAILTPVEVKYNGLPYGFFSLNSVAYCSSQTSLTKGDILGDGRYIYYEDNLVLGWDASNSQDNNPWSST